MQTVFERGERKLGWGRSGALPNWDIPPPPPPSAKLKTAMRSAGSSSSTPHNVVLLPSRPGVYQDASLSAAPKMQLSSPFAETASMSSKSKMLKFIATDYMKPGQKRKQSPRACENCRRKKKRCDHVEDMRLQQKVPAPQRPNPPGVQGLSLSEGMASTGRQETDDSSESPSRVPPGTPGTSHFMEISENRTSRVSPSAPSQPFHIDEGETRINNSGPNADSFDCRFIGDLNPEAVFLAATSPNTTTGAGDSEGIGIWQADKVRRGHDVSFQTSDLGQPNPFSILAPSLANIMIPLLTEEALSLLPPNSELQALRSIYFEKHHPIFPVLDNITFQAMAPEDPSRILLMQGICLVASMNSNSKNHLCLQKSSSILSPREFGQKIAAAMRTSIELGLVTQNNVLIQALCLLSFFSDGPNGGELSSQLFGRAVHLIHSMGLHLSSHRRSHDSQYQETLLCCIWALDRLNAATHGRPVLMHERDFGKDLALCLQNQSPTFQLFLRVINLLDKVIDLYRPRTGKVTAWEGEFPMFEELLLNCGESQIATSLLATIEILYQAVAILSCRSKVLEEVQYTPTSYVRQSLSASQITSSVEGDFRDHLSWFPFVPYAISLALSVAYRDLRYRKVPTYRTRARAQLVKNCSVLEHFGEHFWFALKMAEMGNLTIQEMDKVYFKVASSRQSTMNSAELQMKEGTGLLKQSPNSDTIDHSKSANMNPSATNEAGFELPDVDLTLPIDLLDLDIFALFDSNFDLDTIDACMGGNLDLSFPATFS